MERRVGAEEEDGEEGGHDDDHQAALDRLLARRPDDLGGLGPHLVEERLGADLCHLPHPRNMPNRPNDPAFPDPNRPNVKPGPSMPPAWRPRAWQEWRGSNPRPSVLETDALPAELHSCSLAFPYSLLHDLGDNTGADGASAL